MTRRTTAMMAAAVMMIGGVPAVAAPEAVACTVTYQVTNEWSTGFGATATIRNDGDVLNGWNLTWTDESFSGATVADSTGTATFRFDEQARITNIESSLHPQA